MGASDATNSGGGSGSGGGAGGAGGGVVTSVDGNTFTTTVNQTSSMDGDVQVITGTATKIAPNPNAVSDVASYAYQDSLSSTAGNVHSYIWPVFQCMGNCVPQSFNQLLLHPAPGVSLTKPVASGATNTAVLPLITLGPIATTVSDSDNSITNTALPGHLLYPGSVTRTVVYDGSSTWIVNTGGGSGAYPWLNSVLAPLVWGLQSQYK